MEIDKSGIVYKKLSIKKIDGEIVVGYVNLGIKKRISDFINDKNQFIAVIDSCTESYSNKILIVNKSHIIHIEPMDN